MPPVIASKSLTLSRALSLDSGQALSDVQIAFETYGELAEDRSNAILVCHALTGDQYVASNHPITGKPGWRAFTFSSRSRPEPPGIRISLTSTWGGSSVSFSNAPSASETCEKHRVVRFSRASALSSTKRIDWSSSTIQIGLAAISGVVRSKVAGF